MTKLSETYEQLAIGSMEYEEQQKRLPRITEPENT
jgi:hypothetical protein